MALIEYAVHLAPDPAGGFVVTCRDLPALITQGEDMEDAFREASDAMDEVFAFYMAEGMALPAPTPARRDEYLVSPPAETVAKARSIGADSGGDLVIGLEDVALRGGR